jgi:hypothetical protein
MERGVASEAVKGGSAVRVTRGLMRSGVQSVDGRMFHLAIILVLVSEVNHRNLGDAPPRSHTSLLGVHLGSMDSR